MILLVGVKKTGTGLRDVAGFAGANNDRAFTKQRREWLADTGATNSRRVSPHSHKAGAVTEQTRAGVSCAVREVNIVSAPALFPP